MRWVFLSPHLDDAVYSCGGIIAALRQTGHAVEIWSIFAGDPPAEPLSPYAASLHARWQTGPQAVTQRRAEDIAACAAVGALPVHFHWPDCIYRRLPGGEPVVQSDEELFRPFKAGEQHLLRAIASELAARLPADACLVSPLTLGGHMDHRLVRAAAEQLAARRCYYADFPYAWSNPVDWDDWLLPEWQSLEWSIDQAALTRWQNGAAAYISQISTFWKDEADLRADLLVYLQRGAGARTLWGLASPLPPP